MRPDASIVRIAASAVATALGWTAAYAAFASVEYAVSGRVTDTVPVLFWTGVFVAIGWLVVFVPLVVVVRTDSAVFRPLTFGTIGAALAMGLFAALVAWWTGLWASWPYWLFAAVVGFVAASVYGSWLRHTLRRQEE